ncbi:MAG: hypothetical protein OEV30_01015 [Ignavibacteria bacterium]|nr:hypothetical protein [Ignavibacteria bacterium]
MTFKHCRWRIPVLVNLMFLAGVHSGYGNDEAAANPTRPSVSDNAYLTAERYAEIEIGGLFLDRAWSIPTLLKLGVTADIEVAAAMTGILNYSSSGGTDLGAPGVQAKWQAVSGEWGALAAVGRIDWPNGTGPLYTAYPVLSLRSLPVAIDATAGAFFSNRSGSYLGSFLYAVALSPKLEGDIGFFVELFGIESSSSSSTGIDAGVSYGMTPQIVFDVAANAKISGDAEKWGFQAGFTWTLGRVW